ncbi:MAG: VWA domain-containing protein [Silvibacterium sp.]
MSRSLRLLAASLFLCPVAIPAQTTPATTIQITSRIVYIDVVVRDSAGRIVRGLTEKDFRVLEDGKPQTVTLFSDHTHDPAPDITRSSNSGDKLEFENVDASGTASNSVNIILFDFLNTAPQDQLYARKQMIRFLEALPPGRQTALFVLDSRLRMLQSFTGGTDRLVAAAKRMMPEPSSVETIGEEQQDADLGSAFAAAIGRSPSGRDPISGEGILRHGQDEIQAAAITQTALEQIAAAVSGYPGRKNLYWLADNFPAYGGPALELHDAAQSMINSSMSTADMADANNAEASAQIAIYPISLMGLDASGMGAEARGMTSTQQMFTARVAMHEMLNNLADTTGGRAYYGTNDFAGALGRGFEDGSNYYSLAYEPQNEKWNGQFRKISVKLAERGYSLTYRRGYYARPDSDANADSAALLNAALQPETPEVTMLQLHAKIQLPDKTHPALRVDSIIDPANVNFSSDSAGRRHARLLVSLVAIPDAIPDSNKDQEKTPTTPMQASGIYVVDLDPAGFIKLLTAGMPMHQELHLAPGNYRLRLGVTDLSNHRLGTLDMPIQVEASTGPA